MKNGTRLTVLSCIIPVDVLRVVVARQTVDQGLVLRNPLNNLDVSLTLWHLNDVLGRLGSTPTAVVNQAVPRFVREKQVSVRIVGVPNMLSEQATALTTVIEAFKANHSFQVIAHLSDRLVETNIEAPVQGARIVVAVVDGTSDLGIHDEHRTKHGQNLELRITFIVLVEVFEAVLAIDTCTAAKSKQLKITESVVTDERTEGLSDHIRIDCHACSFHRVLSNSLLTLPYSPRGSSSTIRTSLGTLKEDSRWRQNSNTLSGLSSLPGWRVRKA